MHSIYRTLGRNAFRLVYQSRHLVQRQQFNFLVFQNIETKFHRAFCDRGASLGKVDEATKMYLQFTCKVCQERNSYIISKLAYQKGVVIVECQKCKNNHLIADNLKWFRDQSTNIEDLLKEKGEQLRNKSNTIEFLPEEDNKAEHKAK